MLSLGLSRAFNNVLYKRLLQILRNKGLLNQIINFVQAFLIGRTTKIVIKGYKSELILIPTGILQGLPLLLILFLFFISKLLEIFDNSKDIIALGFINDINLIIQGNIVAALGFFFYSRLLRFAANCRKLYDRGGCIWSLAIRINRAFYNKFAASTSKLQ